MASPRFHVMGHFHSNPMQIAVERGLLTLAAWLWFVRGVARAAALRPRWL